IFKNALRAPFNTMANNAGINPEVAALKIDDCKNFEGINFSTGAKADLLREGIIDPAKVTRCALKNAVSVAGTLLLTNHSIVES
ncbi:MAG TPA: molecular chaperone GroEL, partial [Maribacter sp.]|nr:molecular chaperone GroEL [Maribacter sp.]